MTTKLPADQASRERLLRELETSFFLQAGAGAGKTRILVERVVELVRLDRAELRRIVAITFTEKAAGELRARVREALARARSDPNTSAEQAKRLDLALLQVDVAHIETIHAFASSLLKEHPFDAGIDPNFVILDALGADLDFSEGWHNWLWRAEDPDALEAIERALQFDLSLANLREAAQRLSQNRDLAAPPSSPDAPDPFATLKEWQQRARSLMIGYQNAGSSNQAGQAEILLDWLNSLPNDNAEELRRQMLLKPPPHRNPGGSPKREDLAALKEEWKEFQRSREAYAAAVRAELLNDLLSVLGRFVHDEAERRKREGRLTYEDLLIEARDLLVSSPAARRDLRARYSHILIDEFQDTDPLQAEIVLLLASEQDTADWSKARPAAGRLLVVGDPQQSIYRFRRADIDTYTRVRGLFAQAAEADPTAAAEEQLTVNFRSRPDLIGWFNSVHAEILAQNPEYPRAQVKHQILDSHREEAGPAVLAVPSQQQQFRTIADARKAEADTVARIIRELVDGRGDFGQVEGRKPNYRDIAVLINTRTALDDYITELEQAGIPYHHDSGKGFFERQEIRDLRSILTALDDPSDELAVVAALKSPPWSASDQELYDYSRSSGQGRRARFSLRPEEIPSGYQGPLRTGLKELIELRESLRNRSLPDFVGRVLRETRLLESQFALPRGQLRAANLLMLVQRAADFAEAGEDSLRPFVRWLSERAATDLSEAESATSEAADDVVRILTIHQAKGLEFPIVLLPKLASGSRDRNTFIVDRQQGRIDFALGSGDARWQTEGFERAKEKEAAYTDAERRRLLYVATTRARDWLIVPIYTTAQTTGFHHYLESAIPNWLAEDNAESIPEQDGLIVRRADRFDAAAVPARTLQLVDAAAITRDWAAQHEAALAGGAITLRAVTPSALGHDETKREREDPSPERESDDADPEPVIHRVSGTQRGEAIHRILSLAALDRPDETLHNAQRICAELDLPESEVLPDVRRALAHPLLARAQAAHRRFFELPMVWQRGSDEAVEVLEGYADLAFEEQTGWVVVDFKSDRRVNAAQLERYQRQVAAYGEMLAATGVRVSEAWLLFTNDGRAVPVPLATDESDREGRP